MKFSTGLALAGLAASVSGLDYASTACADKGVHLIAAGGEYTTQGNLSYLLPLAQSILAAFPGSNMYQVPYTEDATAQMDLEQAIPAFSDHFTQYAAACPNTKIVTVGYSIGAAIVMDTFCGGTFTATNPDPLPRDYRHNLLANIIYGDPTFSVGMRSSENAGTCTTGSGVAKRVYPGKCYPFGRKTKSYCNTNDPQCCSGPTPDPNVHFVYPSEYDAAALDWIKAKWAYYKNHSK